MKTAEGQDAPLHAAGVEPGAGVPGHEDEAVEHQEEDAAGPRTRERRLGGARF